MLMNSGNAMNRILYPVLASVLAVGCSWKRSLLTPLLLLAALPASALSLTDYLNQATVTASGDQFETATANNSASVQVTPNAELIIVKEVVNDDGGDLVLADFAVSTNAGVLTFDGGTTVATTTTYTAATLYLSPGTYSLSESNVDGYSEGDWSCSGGTLTDSSFDTGSLTLAFGEQVTCTIVNDDIAPQLTLAASITNNDGGALVSADFDPSINSTEVPSGVAQTVLANTAIAIEEADIPGYMEGSWDCIDVTGLSSGLPGSGAAGGTSVTLAPGANVTCSIVNDDIAPTLTLVKEVVNDDGGNLAVGDFAIAIDNTVVTSEVATTVLANTDITISEPVVAGYAAGAWSCSDSTTLSSGLPLAGTAAGATFQLAPGAIATCTISNDDIAPLLTLAVNLTNDNGGDAVGGDFNPSIGSTVVTSGSAQTVLANTSLNISQLGLPGYSEGNWSCTDDNSLTTGLPGSGAANGTALTLASGADVICVIDNDDIAPLLTLINTVTNDDGGALAAADFNLSIDGGAVTSDSTNTVMANTAIGISELVVPGYAAGDWECLDANSLTSGLPSAGDAAGVSLTLEVGSDVTCTIANNDIAPTLTLSATVLNSNGGGLSVADFNISIDGAVVANNVAQTKTANIPITISELDLASYSEGGWSCVDANTITTGLPGSGAATSTTFNLWPGSDVTCSIVNDDLGIDLSIAKSVDDMTPDIGQTITFTLVVANAGPDTATNVTVNDIVPAGFTYQAASITGGSNSDDTDPGGAGLSWQIASLPAGSPVTLTFEAVVGAP